MWTRAFWKDALERTASSIVIFAATLIITNATDLLHADWASIGNAVLTAAVVTLAKTLIASQVGPKGTAGFVSVPAVGRHRAP